MGCALRISKIEENKDARCLRHVVLRKRGSVSKPDQFVRILADGVTGTRLK